MTKPILALTLHQPWAHLIAIGAKQFETRSWSTPYRGWLVIHAGMTKEHVEDVNDWLVSVTERAEKLGIAENGKTVISKLPSKYERDCILACMRAGMDSLTEFDYGAMICIAALDDCILMTNEFIEQQTEQETNFGHWEPGRYAWKLSHVRRITPIPYRGMQKLWQVPENLVLSLNARNAEEEQAIRDIRGGARP